MVIALPGLEQQARSMLESPARKVLTSASDKSLEARKFVVAIALSGPKTRAKEYATRKLPARYALPSASEDLRALKQGSQPSICKEFTSENVPQTPIELLTKNSKGVKSTCLYPPSTIRAVRAYVTHARLTSLHQQPIGQRLMMLM